jgi:hypothetical protein
MPLCSVADDKLSRKFMTPSSSVKKVPTVLLKHREEMRRNKEVFGESPRRRSMNLSGIAK